MELLIEPDAQDALGAMAPKVAASIVERMKAIAADPFGRHPQVKPLAGTEHSYRLRVGRWRAIYAIDRSTDSVVLKSVKQRKDAYK